MCLEVVEIERGGAQGERINTRRSFLVVDGDIVFRTPMMIAAEEARGCWEDHSGGISHEIDT